MVTLWSFYVVFDCLSFLSDFEVMNGMALKRKKLTVIEKFEIIQEEEKNTTVL
jgi:hypothetical protein